MAILSIITFIVSILGFILYTLLFTAPALKGLFIAVTIISIILPPIAKKVRIMQEKQGKVFETLAIVVAGLNFYFLIFALTTLPLYVGFLGWVVCGIACKIAN